MKKVLKGLLILLLVLLLAAGGYVGYVYFSYSRLPEHQILIVEGRGSGTMQVGERYTVATSNVGYGANGADYSFFMDGGEHGKALSEASVRENTAGIIETLQAQNPDLLLLQEVDLDSDRSHHFDQQPAFKEGFPGFAQTFAVNYDSAYLPYPLTDPIGKSKSGLMTMSRFPLSGAERIGLPIQEGFSKLIDLDRCLSVQRIEVDAQELVLINAHLSAYTSDPAVREAQMEALFGLMREERERGNYVICGGDFNCDLTGKSVEKFGFDPGAFSWTRPFPVDSLPEGFSVQASDDTPTGRNTGEPYQPGHTMVLTLDGFIVSDNVDVLSVKNAQTGFANSDHEPVAMEFVLK